MRFYAMEAAIPESQFLGGKVLLTNFYQKLVNTNLGQGVTEYKIS